MKKKRNFFSDLVEMFNPTPKTKEEIRCLQIEREEKSYKRRFSEKKRIINEQIESIGRTGAIEEQAVCYFIHRDDEKLYEDLKKDFEDRGFICFYVNDPRLGNMKFLVISWW